jgi:hypothetical protein
MRFKRAMTDKGSSFEYLRAYSKKVQSQGQGRGRGLLDFVPESFVLPGDEVALLERMQYIQHDDDTNHGNGDNNGNVKGRGGGMDLPWAIKLSKTDMGNGIAIVGPHSEELLQLRAILSSSSSNSQRTANQTTATATSYATDITTSSSDEEDQRVMQRIKNEVILASRHKHDTNVMDMDTSHTTQRSTSKSKPSKLKKGEQIVVQRYITNELTYQQKYKFDVRVYMSVVSVDPLVVLYHDGFIRVHAGQLYDANHLNFTSTADHLTNTHQTRKTSHGGGGGAGAGTPITREETMASFDEFEQALKQHVHYHQDQFAFPPHVQHDPLGHLRHQMKAALATAVASVRHVAFRGYTEEDDAPNNNDEESSSHHLPQDNYKMQNAFDLFGADFIITQDLRVY